VKRFTLGEHLKVYSASLEDGILRVEVHKEIPEAMKPKQIPILG
jgi:molecular chaperone IbpA